MARYLLDSDVIIEVLHSRSGALELLERLVANGDTLCVCTVVLAEVYSGLGKNPPSQARDLLDACVYLRDSRRSAVTAGEWRYRYARHGIQLSTTDVLVASTAVAHDATLVTGNARDYPMPEVRLLALAR